MKSLKLGLRSIAYTARHLAMRSRGHVNVNPACRNWEIYPARKMARSINHAMSEARIKTPVRSLIDHGCWDGHYAKMLRPHTERLIGLDILDATSIPGYDQYIKASPEPGLSYLSPLPDNSIDMVVIIASAGMHVDGKHDAEPHFGDWADFVSNPVDRQGRYFTPNNYPRVVSQGGHIVVQEWEAYPELRLGKSDPHTIRKRINEFYPHAELPGFKVVAKGVSPDRIGPYIVYRKD